MLSGDVDVVLRRDGQAVQWTAVDADGKLGISPCCSSSGAVTVDMNEGEPRSAMTVTRVHGMLASILEGAVKGRRINTNTARDVNLHRKRAKKDLFLTHAQFERLAVKASQHGTLVRFLPYTGAAAG